MPFSLLSVSSCSRYVGIFQSVANPDPDMLARSSSLQVLTISEPLNLSLNSYISDINPFFFTADRIAEIAEPDGSNVNVYLYILRLLSCDWALILKLSASCESLSVRPLVRDFMDILGLLPAYAAWSTIFSSNKIEPFSFRQTHRKARRVFVISNKCSHNYIGSTLTIMPDLVTFPALFTVYNSAVSSLVITPIQKMV